MNCTQLAPKTAVLCEINEWWRPSSRSRSLKVIDFGTNPKPINNFLLVNNTNLYPISNHFRFRVVAAYWSNFYWSNFDRGCLYLAPSFGANPWSLDCEVWPKKLIHNTFWYFDFLIYWTMLTQSNTSVTDRQTDRITTAVKTNVMHMYIFWNDAKLSQPQNAGKHT